MKSRVYLFVGMVVCVGMLLAAGVSSQQAQQPQATGKEETPEAMMAKLAQPGVHHEVLKAMVGTWDMAGKSWMSPAVEPAVWDGKAEKKMILGGRYLQEDVHSEMMGQPFTGLGIVGYDNVQNKYIWIWLDDMSTGIMVSEGDADESGKTLTLVGDYVNPMTQLTETAKTVVHVIDNDNHTVDMYMKGPDGAEYKSMEIAYTRAK
jgi:hypothetical protein